MKMKIYFGLGILIYLLSACTVQPTSLQASPTFLAETASAISVPTDNTPLYKAAVERYFNAYIQADLDTLLDSLDPQGPMYPQPAAIEQLRASTSGNALQGEAVVKDLTVIEDSTDTARVNVTLYMRVDVNSNGNFQEETSAVICELRFKDGKWRLYNVETQ